MIKPNQAEQVEINNTIKGCLSIFKQWIVDHTLIFRFILLVFSALLGVYLALWWFKGEFLPFCSIISEIISFKESISAANTGKSTWLDSSLTTLLLALPTLLLLWIFRTLDTREQIDKTETQIERTEQQIKKTQISTLTSSFIHALDMISSHDLKRRAMGLIQLAQLKKQTIEFKDFDAQIDAATRRLDLSADLLEGAPPVENQLPSLIYSSLENMDLSYAKLSGANLISAILSGANLIGATLSVANLVGANLVGAQLSDAQLRGAYLSDANLNLANLNGANLNEANLRGTALSGAKLNSAILSSAKLSDATDLLGAKYNGNTLFPEGFNPKARGMVKVFD